MPTQMRDRWANRAEPAVGYGTVYWHVLMRGHPGAVAAVAEAQEMLSSFPGFHRPPPEWLHMTMLVAGPTTAINRAQMRAMLALAQTCLGGKVPAAVSIGRVLYHPEAIMLAVEPRKSLVPILDAVIAATAHVCGDSNEFARLRESWTPHVTVSYSTASQDARPITATLGRSVHSRTILIDSVSLVVQWGPERAWDWQTAGTVRLGHPNQGCGGE